MSQLRPNKRMQLTALQIKERRIVRSGQVAAADARSVRRQYRSHWPHVRESVVSLRTILVANIVALAIALASAGALAWASANSRNLALAFSTLCAAVFLFLIQLRFELRDSRDTEYVSTEFTLDRLKPQIRQWKYPNTGSWRLTLEVQASDWLAANNPQAFQ